MCQLYFYKNRDVNPDLIKGNEQALEGSEDQDAWFTDGNDGTRVHKIKANTHSSWGLCVEATQLPLPSSAPMMSGWDHGLFLCHPQKNEISPCHDADRKMSSSAVTTECQSSSLGLRQ